MLRLLALSLTRDRIRPAGWPDPGAANHDVVAILSLKRSRCGKVGSHCLCFSSPILLGISRLMGNRVAGQTNPSPSEIHVQRGAPPKKGLARPKLSVAQLRQIERSLKRGPVAAGYASGPWTAGRVRELIEYQCGVRYHEAHVWRILQQLGWTWQRLIRRALEGDEQAIRYWKQVHRPRINKSTR